MQSFISLVVSDWGSKQGGRKKGAIELSGGSEKVASRGRNTWPGCRWGGISIYIKGRGVGWERGA